MPCAADVREVPGRNPSFRLLTHLGSQLPVSILTCFRFPMIKYVEILDLLYLLASLRFPECARHHFQSILQESCGILPLSSLRVHEEFTIWMRTGDDDWISMHPKSIRTHITRSVPRIEALGSPLLPLTAALRCSVADSELADHVWPRAHLLCRAWGMMARDMLLTYGACQIATSHVGKCCCLALNFIPTKYNNRSKVRSPQAVFL